MTPRSREAALVAAIVGVCGAGIWAATRTSYFSADDWLNLTQAREHGMSWDYLTLGYFGHFAPLHRTLDWLWAVKLPGDWGAYLAVMLALYAIAVAAAYVLLRALGCGVALAAAATILFASSVVWVRIIQWPASSEHVVPALAATAVSLAASALWLRRRTPWLLAVAGGAMVTGLLAYEKPVLIVGYVVLLRYFVLAPSLQPRALLERARGDWPLLAVLGGIACAYAVLVVAGGYSDTQDHPGGTSFAEFLGRSWVRGTGSLAIGQGSPEYADPIPLGLVILAQVLLAAALVVSVLRRRSAWRAWAFLLICWLVNLGLIGLARIAVFGTGIALDPRYNAEMALLLPLALALAFAPAPGAAPARRPRPAIVLAAATGVALLAVSTANAYRRVERSWSGTKARVWAERVKDTAGAFADPRGHVSVVNGAAPRSVIGINLPPYNLLSAVLPVVLEERADFDGSGSTLVAVARDGTVRSARIRRLSGGPFAAPECGPARVQRSIDNRGAEVYGYVRVDVTPPRRALHIDVLADRSAGFEVLPTAIRLDRGSTSGGTIADMTGIRTLELRLPAGVCVRSLSTVLAS